VSHDTLHADAVSTLTGWPAPDHGQAALREAFLGLLAARPDATARECTPGHITASVYLFSADRKSVLLTLHPRVGRWLQLGGHCEPGDTTLTDAALREGTEESGIAGIVVDPVPLSVDVHPITCSLGVPTRHFDVRYLALAPAGAVPEISAESKDLRFFDVDDLPADVDQGMRDSIALALARSL